MNSIENRPAVAQADLDANLHAALRRLADPLFDALAATASALPPFPVKPAPDMPSYYTQRSQTTMRREDFLAASSLDVGDFAARLAEHWRRAGQLELARLAPKIAAAARDMHALHVSARPQAKLSPYVYQMF
jgi:hypothetical protein